MPMRVKLKPIVKTRYVDTIEGLSPAISIDQKTTSKNPEINCSNSNRNI
ncbi:hypothetical protein ACVPOR_01770 [Staphylococcus aureus]